MQAWQEKIYAPADTYLFLSLSGLTHVRQAKKRVLIYGFRVIFSVKGYFSQTVEK